MIDNATSPVLVFTDLDGTLLDHFTYSLEPARRMLEELARLGIPVVPCTSKTFAEVSRFCDMIGNAGPFVVENGAAVYIPEDAFGGMAQDAPDSGLVLKHGYWCREFCEPRQHWLQLLDGLGERFAGSFSGFSTMSLADIAELTGLPGEAAALAAQREYSEPVDWRGPSALKVAFIQQLQARGAHVLQGGRFLHVSGDCDKGRALRYLAGLYQDRMQRNVITIAAGDSGNDVAMLEMADYPLIVRSPVHEPPALETKRPVTVSDSIGPAGWAEGVARILLEIGKGTA